MLITRWPRTRSLPYRDFCSPKRRILRGYHSTPLLLRHAQSHSQGVQPLYVDTVPPTSEQLYASEVFFRNHLPTKSWTATEWRQQPHSESTYLIPEVAFLGRSNSGKSSLLNGLLFDDQLCRVGAKPGKTSIMHAWSLSPIDPQMRGARKGYQGDMEPKLTVLDMPGYGHGSHGEWGEAIMKYLTARRQLRRAFVLVNPLHGLKEQDLQMLELLRGHGIPHQMVACKSDRMKATEAHTLLNKLQARIDDHFRKRTQVPLLVTVRDILTVGGLAQTKNTSKWLDSAQGLQDIRWAILRATGLDDYATNLATNRGVIPKIKHSPSTLTDQSTSDHRPLFQQDDSHRQAQPDDHVPNVADLSLGHYQVPASLTHTSHVTQVPSIGISVEELLSENYSPLSTDSNSLQPSATDEYTRSRTDEAPTRNTSTHNRNALPGQRPVETQRTVPQRAKMQDRRSSRMKDVKRYGGNKR